MSRVLIVFPTEWDARHLAGNGPLAATYEVVLAEPRAEDCPASLDVLGLLDQLAGEHGGRIAGVTSSSDYPGAIVAAALAARLGLPGTAPRAILTASHKYLARLAQRRAVPEATPDFALVDPRLPGGGLGPERFPCFVKPVKGAFSLLAEHIEDAPALQAYLDLPATREYLEDYVRPFNALAAAFGEPAHDGRFFLAEDPLRGRLATVEGYVLDDAVHLLGIVDSVTHPTTGSFLRFDYPSRLPAAVQRRMADIARRAVLSLGLRHTLWNVELIHDEERGTVHVIEVNPRMCGQFADLYEKVDGVNGYAVALALATGRPPPRGRGGPCAVAASFPLRVFEPVTVVRAPDEAARAAAEALFPHTLVWNECASGQLLADFKSGEDGRSARYGVVNIGADGPAQLLERFAQVRERLGYVLLPA